MKDKKYIFSLLLIILLLPFNCYATCLNSDVARVKELAKNITFDYEYRGNIEKRLDLQLYYLKIDFGELDGEVYAKDRFGSNTSFDGGINYAFVNSGEYKFGIYYLGCNDILLREIPITLKKYNEYSFREECQGLEDKVSVCDPWNQSNITEEYFNSIMKGKVKNKNDILNFIYSHIIFFIIGGVILLVGIILLVIKRIKDNRLD